MRYRNLGGQNLKAELDNIQRWADGPTVLAIQFEPLNKEPQRPREGYLAYADGVNWNPGNNSQPGLYLFSGTSWNKV